MSTVQPLVIYDPMSMTIGELVTCIDYRLCGRLRNCHKSFDTTEPSLARKHAVSNISILQHAIL